MVIEGGKREKTKGIEYHPWLDVQEIPVPRWSEVNNTARPLFCVVSSVGTIRSTPGGSDAHAAYRVIGVWQQDSGKGPRLGDGAAYCVPDLTLTPHALSP